MGGMTGRRITAAAAALAVSGGAGTMLVALIAAPGAWWQGYVSEAGTAGQPYAVPYRWGLVVLAVGVALLAAALRAGGRREARQGRPTGWWLPNGRPPDGRPLGSQTPAGRTAAAWWQHRPTLHTAAVLCLGVASLMAATSGVVPCTDRCPLPPYEPTTVGDVVHTVASIVGLLLLAAAMAALAFAGRHPVERRLAAVAVTSMVPLGVALGATMLITGRNTLGAVLERLVLVIAVSWLVGAATLESRPARRRVRPPHR